MEMAAAEGAAMVAAWAEGRAAGKEAAGGVDCSKCA